MKNNVIEEYIVFLTGEIRKLYRLILEDDYDSEIIETLLEKYVQVRYYNETIYPKVKDFTERMSMEMRKVLEPLILLENEDNAKNIYALFAYIFYFDGCYYVNNQDELLEYFFEDKDIQIEFDNNKKKSIKKFFKLFNTNKDKFHEVFRSKDFFVDEMTLKSNLYKVVVKHNVRISNLYSEYAIDKAYNTEVIKEDRMFMLLMMTSDIILRNAINLDFSRYYVVDFVSSLFEKEKKISRGFKIIDNILAKKQIVININYEDYLQNKLMIDELIKQGYSFSITIDSSFNDEFSNLLLFSYVFLYENSEKYDIIMENKENIITKIIIL